MSAAAKDVCVGALLLLLAGLCMPPVLGRAAARVPALGRILRLVGHVGPVVAMPAGLLIMARDGSFVVALLALAAYLAGAVRAAHLRSPRLTAEMSLLHPWLELRDAIAESSRARAARPEVAVATAPTQDPGRAVAN